jgi:hypothetical protein
MAIQRAQPAPNQSRFRPETHPFTGRPATTLLSCRSAGCRPVRRAPTVRFLRRVAEGSRHEDADGVIEKDIAPCNRDKRS